MGRAADVAVGRWAVENPWPSNSAVDPESDAVTGRPWHVASEDQGDAPPAGVWVSCKDDKSDVYDLVHV